MMASAVAGAMGCAREEAAQQQAQALLQNGIATDMRHNTLMDAAFGVENGLIVPGEVYWQADLPLPVMQRGADPAGGTGQAQSHARAASGVSPEERAAPGPEALGVTEIRRVAIRPREAVRLNDTQVALVVESFPWADVQGDGSRAPEPEPRNQTGAQQAAGAGTAASAGRSVANAASASAHMGVIFFHADATAKPEGHADTGEGVERWRAVRFMPHVDYLMPGQSAPDVQLYKLDADHHLVTYTQTACRAGACSRWLRGYLLQPDAMQGVLSVRLAGSNVGQHADCPVRLGIARAGAKPNGLAGAVGEVHARQSANARGQAASAAMPAGSGGKAQGHACYVVDGEVHLVSRGRAESADVQIRYGGAMSDAPGQLRRIAQTHRFRLQNGKLAQIEGGPNPVPEQEGR